MHWNGQIFNTRGYAPVQTHDFDKQSENSGTSDFLNISQPARRECPPSLSCVLPWALTVILTILSITLLILLNSSPQLGSYEADFEIDFFFPSPIPLHKVRFRGSPHFHNNGSPWADPPNKEAAWPENLQYVGDPSPEVDQNWQRLIERRYFSLSEQEAQRAWGERRHDFVDQNAGGYTAGFDMFHTLHCLNEIRKSLRPEYYFADGQRPARAAFHNDHCIEILRQTVQCYGSTTLIPTRYIDGIEHNYIDSDQEHVCRSFNFLRDYSSWRAADGEGAIPRDQSLVNKTKQALAMAWGAKYGDNEKSGSR